MAGRVRRALLDGFVPLDDAEYATTLLLVDRLIALTADGRTLATEQVMSERSYRKFRERQPES